jgi:hypothetical protein
MNALEIHLSGDAFDVDLERLEPCSRKWLGVAADESVRTGRILEELALKF